MGFWTSRATLYDRAFKLGRRMPSGSMLAVSRRQHTALFCVFGRKIADNPLCFYPISATKKRFLSRYNFGYGILLYIRKIPYFSPKTAHFGGFEGIFSYFNDKSAILCPGKTEVADFVSFKGSIVQGIDSARQIGI